jgi:hypothetical protein
MKSCFARVASWSVREALTGKNLNFDSHKYDVPHALGVLAVLGAVSRGTSRFFQHVPDVPPKIALAKAQASSTSGTSVSSDSKPGKSASNTGSFAD